MVKEMTWSEAIATVLASTRAPLHYSEITDRIIAERLRTSLGATPSATVNALIASSIKHKGATSPYLRVGKGIFALRNPLAGSTVNEPEELGTESGQLEPEDSEEQYAIISSFAMFWRRESVNWSRSPRLLGKQQIGATPVDFCTQRGVYLLYDGREVVYVGRAMERALGLRLFEHTADRLSARWDRFSWFGVCPVSEAGTLGEPPESTDASKLIPALEAILIEALEPRQNRKRGDDLAAVEYMQHLDPAIQKKRLKAAVEEALG